MQSVLIERKSGFDHLPENIIRICSNDVFYQLDLKKTVSQSSSEQKEETMRKHRKASIQEFKEVSNEVSNRNLRSARLTEKNRTQLFRARLRALLCVNPRLHVERPLACMGESTSL